MKVLYLDWEAFGKIDYPFSLENEFGIEIAYFMHKDFTKIYSEDFLLLFERYVNELHCDFAFSINYFPLMAEGAKRCGVPYISVVYDSPQYFLYHKSIYYETNHVYVFDSSEVAKLNALGAKGVKYTILPVNSVVINSMLKQEYNIERTTCEVSFVGQLYDKEPNSFLNLMRGLDDYSQGYIRGLMAGQMNVYGADLIRPAITDDLLAKMTVADMYQSEIDSGIDPKDVYADLYICRGVTQIERMDFLKSIAKKHQVKLFTSSTTSIPNVINMGETKYYDEMPLIFHNSKINLNITLRSIKSGIPLRAMDIIGAGGFLLTNYQSDFLQHFIPDKEYVYFEDKNDMLRKIDYYLEHENQRNDIARAGWERAKRQYSFKAVLGKILEESLA